jgi:hypothetical protein
MERPEMWIKMNPGRKFRALESLEQGPMDVDRWEMVISPTEYLRRFKDTLATVQLVNRAPIRRLHSANTSGPAFDQWLLLADSTHQLWISPKYKDDFFLELDEYQVAQPGQFPLQASMGRALVPTSVFIYCLIQTGCDSIRLKAYGQKMPLDVQFLRSEPADVNHRWAKHNEWDIGTTFKSPDIWLFDNIGGRTRGVERYPVMIPVSLDYGTVNIKATHKRRKFKIKIYARLVHVIKSFNSHLQGSIPTTLSGVCNQVQAGLSMIHNLSGKVNDLGGFRIEVTVRAASLRDATRFVNETRFLDPKYWLGVGPGPHARTLLQARLIPGQSLLDNANWVYQRAAEAQVFKGDNNRRPSAIQIKALTDILNALGWNRGLRRPSKSLSLDAWWNGIKALDNSGLLGRLTTMYQSDDDIKELFNLARLSAGAVPCKAHPNKRAHRYQVNNTSPFRIRCCMPGCYHKLQRSAIIYWLVMLVKGEVLDGDVLLGEEE